jgi:hypothetical protein
VHQYVTRARFCARNRYGCAGPPRLHFVHAPAPERMRHTGNANGGGRRVGEISGERGDELGSERGTRARRLRAQGTPSPPACDVEEEKQARRASCPDRGRRSPVRIAFRAVMRDREASYAASPRAFRRRTTLFQEGGSRLGLPPPLAPLVLVLELELGPEACSGELHPAAEPVRIVAIAATRQSSLWGMSHLRMARPRTARDVHVASGDERKFPCATLACDTGQVGVEFQPQCDGCQVHECVDSPQMCASAATCACSGLSGCF